MLQLVIAMLRARRTDYLTPIDADNEVIPGFQWYFVVLVSKYLKASCSATKARILDWTVGIKARDESIECTKDAHSVKFGVLRTLCFWSTIIDWIKIITKVRDNVKSPFGHKPNLYPDNSTSSSVTLSRLPYIMSRLC